MQICCILETPVGGSTVRTHIDASGWIFCNKRGTRTRWHPPEHTILLLAQSCHKLGSDLSSLEGKSELFPFLDLLLVGSGQG
jgi:hypothetical protein